MAYRNGTYVIFHAAGTADPSQSDMKYYNLLKAWHVREESDFSFANSHEKTAAVRDSSARATLRARLSERLRNSKNAILIVSEITKRDTDWVPFEIEYAVDACKIPIIAAYPDYNTIQAPHLLASLWPAALATRIANATAHVIHVPFREAPLADSVNSFTFANYPLGGALGRYSIDAYRNWGLA
jgi:hypothetical protein